MGEVNKEISDDWDCLSSVNCTVTDNVISIQWASSNVTLEPIYYGTADNAYIPVSNSMASWGINFTTPGVMYPPEFAAYLAAPYSLPGLPASWGSVMTYLEGGIFPVMNDMFATDYTWYGLNNIYNTMMLMQNFAESDYIDGVNSFNQYWTDTAAWYGLTNDELYYFFSVMRLHVSSFLLETPAKSYCLMDLVKGFNTPLVNKIN